MISVPLILIAFTALASVTFGLVGWLCFSRGGLVARFIGQLAACVAVVALLLTWLMYTERVSIKVTFPNPSCPEGILGERG